MVAQNNGIRPVFTRKRTLSLTPWAFRLDRVSRLAWLLSIVTHGVVTIVLARQLVVDTAPRVPDSSLPAAWLEQITIPLVAVDASPDQPAEVESISDVAEMIPEVTEPEMLEASVASTDEASDEIVQTASVAPVLTMDSISVPVNSSAISNYWMSVRARFSSSLKWPSRAHGSITAMVHMSAGPEGLRFLIPPGIPSPYADSLERAARRVTRTMEPPPPDAGSAYVMILFDEP